METNLKILVIGTGYVGLITALGLAEVGHDITATDIDEGKISRLKKCEPIIFEEGLEELLHKHKNNIKYKIFSSDIIADYDVIFICVGTPQNYDGSTNLSYLDAVSHQIAKGMKDDKYVLIVNKSTVPPKTARRVENIIKSNKQNALFDVASNPEFLKEGTAINDFLNPDRIVVGADNPDAFDIMEKIYKPFVNKGFSLYKTDVTSAELIKYASNVFLATKITFVNELSHLCEQIGADITKVTQGMGLDPRIGDKFLNAGPGYGGSCFPKDTLSLSNFAKQEGVTTNLIDAVISVNSSHVLSLSYKTKQFFARIWDGHDTNKHIAVLGLSFKAGTDDVRDSVALRIIPILLDAGYTITAYDPAAMDNARSILPNVTMASSIEEALDGKDGILLLTEWDEFKHINWSSIKPKLRYPAIMDMRNIYDRDHLKGLGYNIWSIGRSEV